MAGAFIAVLGAMWLPVVRRGLESAFSGSPDRITRSMRAGGVVAVLVAVVFLVLTILFATESIQAKESQLSAVLLSAFVAGAFGWVAYKSFTDSAEKVLLELAEQEQRAELSRQNNRRDFPRATRLYDRLTNALRRNH